MINKKFSIKIKNNNILFNSLLKSKNFYGKNIKKINKNNLSFIFGVRHNFTIIDLKYVLYFIKRIFKLVQFNIIKKKKILIIGNSNDIKFLVNKNFIKNNKNIFFFNQSWINGFITNKNYTNFKYFLNQNSINLIFILKTNENEEFITKELLSLKVPIISLVNIDQNLNDINYPILSNLNNIKSLYILMYLIRKIF